MGGVRLEGEGAPCLALGSLTRAEAMPYKTVEVGMIRSAWTGGPQGRLTGGSCSRRRKRCGWGCFPCVTCSRAFGRWSR